MDILRDFYRKCTGDRQSFLINVLSLVPGLICCLLILSWLIFQFGFDCFHTKIDRIANVYSYHDNSSGKSEWPGAPACVAPMIKEKIPGVEFVARTSINSGYVIWGDKNIRVLKNYSDPDLFQILSFKFIGGSPFKAGETDQCVITRAVARRVFGTDIPVGQKIEIKTGSLTELYTVSGVVDDFPKNTTLAFEVLLPIDRMYAIDGPEALSGVRYVREYQTYVLLASGQKKDDFENGIKDLVYQVDPEFGLYLGAAMLKDRYVDLFGDPKKMQLVTWIAALMLLVACINFTNLSTAGFTKNAFQTGIRKVIGATGNKLIRANFTHTFFTVLIAFVMAVVGSILVFPYFTSLISDADFQIVPFTLHDFFSPLMLGVGVTVILATTLIAGIYPALNISSFAPLRMMRGGADNRGNAKTFRNMLVVGQFAVSIVLVVLGCVVVKQVDMFRHMDMGYNREEIVYFKLSDGEAQRKSAILKEELLRNTDVCGVTLATGLPVEISSWSQGWTWEGRDVAEGNSIFCINHADEDWARVYDIQLREGHFFDKDRPGVVINSEMARLIGGDTFTDRYLNHQGTIYKITGVLDEVFLGDFKKGASPCIIRPLYDEMGPVAPEYVSVKAEMKNMPSVVQALKSTAAKLNCSGEIGFLNDRVEKQLAAEKQITRIVSLFSVLTVVVSCMGLFGLATFLIGQKRKEIGIRRVNGAKIREIIWLLNIHFVRPILVALFIACPVAYYLADMWLESYVERTAVSWWIFVLAGILTLGVALLTLMWRSWRAARENPVNSLKSE